MNIGVATKVKCDDNLECSVVQSTTDGGVALAQKCCWHPPNASGACAISLNSCPAPATTIRCDSKNDCATGHCCFEHALASGEKRATCAPTCSSVQGFGRMILCSLNSECPSPQTCKPLNSIDLPGGYYACQN
ncbi:MAG: hypothetical protein KF718_10820 [Polyangiaceae bacterium]|nr:hypothetical protein [Polyangiaceae bacterium]